MEVILGYRFKRPEPPETEIRLASPDQVVTLPADTNAPSTVPRLTNSL